MYQTREVFNWKKYSNIIGDNPAYGIRYNILDQNPSCERVRDSKELISGVSVDNSTSINDFDNIYPWSDIRICNIKQNREGITITYQDEDGFSFDGSNGDVMVEIPKYYFIRYREGAYEYILISSTPKEGYQLEPSFIEDGKELNKIYIGRYNNYIENGVPYSKTGTYPTGYEGLINLLDMANEKGNGYSILDLRTLSMLQKLFLVEFATLNSQSVMGGVTKTVYHGKGDCISLYSGEQVNHIIIEQGEQSDKFRVGQRCSVSIDQEYQDRHITEINDLVDNEREILFDGTPVDLIAGETQICNIPVENGRTDFLEYSSGRESGDDDKVSFSYRGIENIYGNIHEIIAGVLVKEGTPYLFNNMSNYNSKDVVDASQLSFKLPSIPYTGAYDATTPYIKEIGYDTEYPALLLPIEAGTTTVGQDYWCDEINSPQGTSETFYCAFGGGWDHYERSGLFNYRFFLNVDNSSSGWLFGSRLICKQL